MQSASAMDSIIQAIQSVPPVVAYAIIGALVFGEAGVFIGFVLPGETSVLLGGFLASTHHLNIIVLCALVVICAIVGDTVGYEVGKHFGPKVLELRPLRKHRSRLQSAQDMLSRRGGPAVLLGRFTAFFRAVMPGLAGLSGMRYPTFLMWNALGGFIWGIGYCLIGYFAGSSYQVVAQKLGTDSAIAIGAIIVVGIVVFVVRRKRREKAEEAEPSKSDRRESGQPAPKS